MIKTGGRNLHEIDLKWWRSQIGLVQQEPFLFNDTIFKNIEYGLIGTEWENESYRVKRGLVKQACKEAFADEFIQRLPQVGLASWDYPNLQNTIIMAIGIQYPGRRCWYQAEWRSTPKTRYCT